ncbi:nucleoside-diphosphate-sugar epimerase [Flavobacterium sp. CG_9.1]|uniref:NAD-dependent epimerase/dehydratase family protein n=1 Tax=Flavobacterium sp. CG_9.1 TaxID=2787728 RepID=UPI0018CBB1E0|nr:NAD-dependent epimerase/dehydratase family protein [Flavobacterium sp. CG_9.1]MBG6062551.1 nucleoside-diphosphate-sugar epimerase [Flavobacterium sp. CG_9.1]
MNRKKKIYITGITGFVGQNLSLYLANEFDLHGISRNKKQGILTYEMFLQDNLPYDAVVHLAGKAHDLKNTSHNSEYYEVNFELTKRLYDQFLQSDAKKFIYISSVKAAADVVVSPLTEEAIPNPITAYGKSKLMAEEYILSNLSATKTVYILRPCMIHGPGNKGNLNLLFALVSKGFPWPLGAFVNQRSFCSIENLCFIIKNLLGQESIPTGVYNVADDESLSTNQLIELIAATQNKRAKILTISKRLIVVAAKIGDYFSLPLNAERLQKLTESYVVSNRKIVKALHKPLPVNAKEGLVKTFRSFK